MKPKFVFYRDYEMTEDWPEKIRNAQLQTSYSIDGQEFRRVRYGREPGDWQADTRHCHDCGVVKGEYHVPTCDVEACPRCRNQAISCGCFPPDGPPDGG